MTVYLIMRLVLLYLAISFGMIGNAQTKTSSSEYWYISTLNLATVSFQVINPANISQSNNIFEVALPENKELNDAVISPDGVWVALDIGYGPTAEILLTNLVSRESLSIGEIFLNDLPLDSLDKPLHRIEWSPDSKMIAFHLFVPGNQQSEQQLAVYDLERQQLMNLNSGDTNQYNDVWLPNSDTLAVVTSSTNPRETWLELFNTTTWQSERKLPLVPVIKGAAHAATVCQLQVSPSGMWASFWYPCDGGSFEFPKEMYVLNLNTGALEPVTNISDPRQDLKPQIVEFSSKWLGDDTLLIGAAYQTITREGLQTLQFNATTKNLMILNDNQAFEERAVNPVNGEIAVLDKSTLASNGNPDQMGTVLFQTENGQPRSLMIASGCRISWSPSGEILAYVVTTAYCHTPTVKAIGFIDRTTGQEIIYQMSESERAFALGWR